MSCKRILPLGLLAGLLLMATACSHSEHWRLTSIRHLVPDLQFSLPSSTGATLNGNDLHGDVVLLYFGYTHCPDVCPLTLAKLKSVLAALGAAGQRVRVLFVSVDPQRDTPPELKRYLSAFGQQFIGLVGTIDQTEAIAKRYRVGYNKKPGGKVSPSGDYEVAHSSGVFVFDPQGHAVLLGTPATPIADYASDLKDLLSRD